MCVCVCTCVCTCVRVGVGGGGRGRHTKHAHSQAHKINGVARKGSEGDDNLELRTRATGRALRIDNILQAKAEVKEK